MNEDSVKLIRECDAGIKIALAAIDELLQKTSDNNLKNLLLESRTHHRELRSEMEELLNSCGIDGKEPGAISTFMSRMKTIYETTIHPGDKTVASLITDGTNMGIKTLCGYLNGYKEAEEEAKKFAERLIDAENELVVGVRKYL